VNRRKFFVGPFRVRTHRARAVGLLAIAITLLLDVGVPGVSPWSSVALAEPAGGSNSLDLGAQSTCSVRANGGLRCFGPNVFGQNGASSLATDMFSTFVPIGGINPRMVSAGDTTTCYATIAGQQMLNGVSCVGAFTVNGGFGAFSVGKNGACTSTRSEQLPNVPITYRLFCGGVDDGSGWAGGSVAGTGVPFTNVQPNTSFGPVALSGSNTCAVVTSAAGVRGVRCWGLSTSPVIAGSSVSTHIAGLPTQIDALAITPQNGCVISVGTVHCWGSTATRVALSPTGSVVPLGAAATSIALGGQGACALLTGGIVRCWGGQYASPSEVMVFGPDSSGSPAIVSQIAMAENHSCVQLTTNEVRCWGDPALLAGSSKNISVPFVELPETRIDSGPLPGSVSARTGTFTFTATPAPGATFSCQIDTNPYVACTSPVTYNLANGPHTFSVVASNSVGTETTPATRSWNVDATDPNVTIMAPSPAQVVTLQGTASDSSTVAAVYVVVYRSFAGGQFWNGTSWQSQYTSVPAGLSSSGASSTNWTYVFDPPQSGGTYYAAGVALDGVSNYSFTPFVAFTIPDSVAPFATITTPLAGSTVGQAIAISGTAGDNNSLYGVRVAVYRASDAKFWNGSGWQTGFVTVEASLASPGTGSSPFVLGVYLSSPGYYLIAALPIDDNYNYSLTPWTTVLVSTPPP
jgi:hypothetical protein